MRRSLLALAVLPFALAACNGTTPNQAAHLLTPTASVKQAASKTSAVTSAHVTLDASRSKGMLTGSVTGSGDFDNTNHRGSFHLEISGYGSIDAVVDGTSAYVKAPLLAGFVPAGKSWLKLNAQRSELKFIPQSPKQALARAKKLANVHVVGDETIDGVDTTHYQGTARSGSGTVDVWIG